MDELGLAKKLKNDYCDKSGKEIYPEKAAQIFYHLGKIYKKQSPDKMILIKSVGLLNAAIVRKPINTFQIKCDLSDLCRHVLAKAGATDQNADLIEIAKEIKKSVSKLRTDVDQFLETTEIEQKGLQANELVDYKTTAFREINEVISKQYKQIMAKLCQICEDIMGTPPCGYVVAGMGSLARSEITPYSDFEHIILLFDQVHDNSSLEYFRWYSVVFHIIILNLGETIIPSLNIKHLNDKEHDLGYWFIDAHTPRGISFDGMMPHACKFPLGRVQHTKYKQFETELIKPVREMLDYLSSDADLKNGYHLADILTKTCFVFGNKEIFEEFRRGVQDKSKSKQIEEVKQQVEDDLDKFSTRLILANLKNSSTINIKTMVYRSITIFIAAFGRIHNILANSCFDIINEMEKLGKITSNTKDKLFYAIALACEIRLRVYSKHNAQCEDANNLRQDGENIKHFLNVIGAASTINYFQIAYCLQCEVAKQLSCTKLRFYSDPQIINFTIGFGFGISSLKTDFSKKKLKIAWNLSKFNFDECIKQLEKSNKSDLIVKETATTIELTSLKKLADRLYLEKIYDEALEFYRLLLVHYTLKSSDESIHENIAKAHNDIGKCLLSLDRLQEALNKFEQAMEIFQKITQDSLHDRYIGMVLNNIGLCLMEKNQQEEALTYLEKSLQILQITTHEQQTDSDIALRLNNIGLCWMEMRNYNKALKFFEQSLTIKQIVSIDQQKDRDVADTLKNIGLCYSDMHHYDDAFLSLKQSLVIYQYTSHDQSEDRDISDIFNNLGLRFYDMHRYKDALDIFEQSLKIAKELSLDQSKDSDIARTSINIGLCLTEMHEYKLAMVHFEQSLQIYQNQSPEQKQSSDIADTLNNMGLCFMDMHKHEIALSNFFNSLAIYKSISRNQQKDRNIAESFNNIGLCLIYQQDYKKALSFLMQSLVIQQDISSEEQKDRDVAETLFNIGDCLIHKFEYEDARSHLNRSLEIYQNISPDCREDHDIAECSYKLGFCLKKMQQYNETVNCFKQSLEIYQNLESDQETSNKVAELSYQIGLLYLSDLHQYGNAQEYFEKALHYFEKMPLNDRTEKRIEDIYKCIYEVFEKRG